MATVEASAVLALHHAEHQCASVLYRFAGYLDRREYDELIKLATADCIWAGMNEARGHAAIRARLKSRPARFDTLHMLSNVVVTVKADGTAYARSVVTVHRFDRSVERQPPPTAVAHTIGIYEDKLICSGNRWLVAEHRLTVMAQAPG